MLDFDKYVARYGEFGVQAIIERLERYEGIRAGSVATLEDRWTHLMGDGQALAANRQQIAAWANQKIMDRNMERITYQDLVARYGNTAAFDLLLTVEKLARIDSNIIRFGEDERFLHALNALNAVDFGG